MKFLFECSECFVYFFQALVIMQFHGFLDLKMCVFSTKYGCDTSENRICLQCKLIQNIKAHTLIVCFVLLFKKPQFIQLFLDNPKLKLILQSVYKLLDISNTHLANFQMFYSLLRCFIKSTMFLFQFKTQDYVYNGQITELCGVLVARCVLYRFRDVQ